MIYIIFIAYLLIRIFPYFSSVVPLGYDPGLYLYLFRIYSHISPFSFTSLPSWLVEVYPPLLPFLVWLVTPIFTPEQILIPLILLAALSLFAATYFLVKNFFNTKAATIAVALLSLSIIQYRFYWYYYVKNIFAVSLLLVLAVMLRRKSKWIYLIAPALVLLHQPTAILMGVLLMARANYKVIAVVALTFAAYYLPNFAHTLLPFLPAFATSIVPGFLSGKYGQESGTFYSVKESIWYMLPYLPLAVVGVWNNFRKYPELARTLLVSAFFAFGVFLSRRFIPMLDILLIIFASATLAKLKVKTLCIYFMALALIFCMQFLKASKTLIQEDEFKEIALLRTTEPGSYILVADNEYTPWVYGYSLRKPITPGFGEYDIYWSYNEWDQFWLSGNRTIELDLLKKLPKPLYIYLGDNQRPVNFRPEGECFVRFSWHVYQFVCK
ncbi:MAG: hypothetical protein WCL07_00810 [bacterium]